MSNMFSPKAPSNISSSGSLVRGSSLLGGGTSSRSASSARMPSMPVAGINKTGNMSPSGIGTFNPLPPVPPMKARLTENPLMASYEKEMNRRGMLSTLLGREPRDATAIFRRNSLSNLIGG